MLGQDDSYVPLPAGFSSSVELTDAMNQMIADGWSADDAYNYLMQPTVTQTYGSGGAIYIPPAPTGANANPLSWLTNLFKGKTAGTYTYSTLAPGIPVVQSGFSSYLPILLIGGIAIFALTSSPSKR